MEEIEAKKKWDDFLDWINSNSTNSYYRGESNNEYLLRPKVGRKNYSLSDELNMFEHFKRRANIYVNAKNDFEWLALAQHHGLSTRLLDWTMSPLVACFFAVMSKIEKTARIYVLDSKMNEPINLDRYNSPFEIDKIHILHPPISTRRIELQKGLFSIHPLPNKPLLIGNKGDSDKRNTLIEVENNYHFNDFSKPIFNEEAYDEAVTKYLVNFYQVNSPYFEIPSNCKRYFEKKIRLLGIDETIFGDIDSIAKNIEYSKENNQLNEITKPVFFNAKPFWKNYIENNIINYFQNKDNIFQNLIDCRNFSNKVFFSIDDEFTDNKRTNCDKSVSGSLYFSVVPNYENYDRINFSDINFYLRNNFTNLIKEMGKDLRLNTFNLIVSHEIKLRINLFCQDFNENIVSISSINILHFDKDWIDDVLKLSFISAENYFNNLKSQISEDDFLNLVTNKLEIDEIKRLAVKYKEIKI